MQIRGGEARRLAIQAPHQPPSPARHDFERAVGQRLLICNASATGKVSQANPSLNLIDLCEDHRHALGWTAPTFELHSCQKTKQLVLAFNQI
jgi:hypothetical protein